MGKFLIIKDANFENVAVEKVNIIYPLSSNKQNGYLNNEGIILLESESSNLFLIFDISDFVNKTINVIASGTFGTNVCYDGFFTEVYHRSTSIGYIGEQKDGPCGTIYNDIKTLGTIPQNAKYFVINCKLEALNFYATTIDVWITD